MKQNKKIMPALGALLLGLIFAVQVNAATVQRSNFIVGNLSCSSCLATIEEELKSVPGTLGVDADLNSGRVTVDHLSTLDYEQIAATITRLGYPATFDWTATLPEQYSRRFSGQSAFSSACSSGSCGAPDAAGVYPTVWKAPPATGTVKRTTLQVNYLSCTYCLSRIAAELRKMPETYGMTGYLSRDVVIVEHTASLDNARIAAVISNLGYPARILALNEIPAQKAFSTNPTDNSSRQLLRTGFGGSRRGPCSATAASWQKLYNRYFSQTNSN